MSLGIFSFFATYTICIVLGIAKAVRSGERFDSLTSVVILFGYSIPGFVLAVLLIVFFGPGDQHILELIPVDGGLTSSTVEGYQDWSLWTKFLDYLHHLAAPILCMSVGGFAVLTILTKNTILEEIHKLYAVAARARGLSERKVLYKHVLRNAMIPLVTGFPSSFLTMFFTGSLLLEKIFNLNGLGLLSYNAVMSRDFPLMIGSLFIFTILKLIGILLTDVTYVLVDPRISFEKAEG
jgi:microcin C transport system permease protein